MDVTAYFNEISFPGLVRDIIATQIAYNWGKDVDGLWADAEEFLVFLDDAATDQATEKKARLSRLTASARRRARPNYGPEYHTQENDYVIWTGLNRAARRALAAETSRFMMSSRDGELWLPYRRWASGLEPGQDTVVTFNYDTLLDELAKTAPLTIPLPQEDPEEGKVPVLKLHGSVNWLAEGGTFKRQRDVEVLTYPSGLCPAIASPGRSKSPGGEPPFPHLWQLAEKAIVNAEWVAFIGYRFPPTDALARFRITRALSSRSDVVVRRIDTVLGPDVDSDASRRLKTLLEAARGERFVEDREGSFNIGVDTRHLQIYRQPLWAEDFLLNCRDLIRAQFWPRPV
ncbi:MAG: hypothetical protein JWM82_3262 [Myxococcales bacterium]|nr:hypothetical protein [Myxococcales bacterium]